MYSVGYPDEHSDWTAIYQERKLLQFLQDLSQAARGKALETAQHLKTMTEIGLD